MNDREFDWPPKRPPKRKDVAEAWNALHHVATAFLKRHVQDGDTRRLIKKLEPRELDVSILTTDEHADRVMDDISTSQDLRPLYLDQPPLEDLGAVSNDEQSDDADSDDEEQGNLGVIGEEPHFSAETRFCIYMAFQHRTSKDDHHFAIEDYSYRRISIHPDTALSLICQLHETTRKTIADALVFMLMNSAIEEEAQEEEYDGDVFPAWRNRENDPALDVIRLCPNLQKLYAEIVDPSDTYDDA